MKKLIYFSPLFYVLIASVAIIQPVFAPAPIPEPEDYQVTFVNVVYNEAGNTSTWTYDITCLGDPEISHSVFEFKFCDPPLSSILDAGPEPWEIVDPDPTTGVNGIKFDSPVTIDETLTVWFTLEGLWDINDIEVWIKAGDQDPYEGPSYLPEGPACTLIADEDEHDVEAISQTVEDNEAEPGDLIDIDVTVRNNGDVTETFDLTCYYDSTEIGTILVVDLAPGETRVVTFTWDTAGTQVNEYDIKAWADSASEIVETEEQNNWCTMPLTLFVVPEVQFGTVATLTIMTITLIGYIGFKRRRTKQ